MKYNLHTHSFYCGHGEGTIQEYVNEAKRLGFGLLGFSEHCPYPDELLHETRMFSYEMPSYERDIREAAKTVSFPVLVGYECDFWPGRNDYLESLKTHTDYLCCGVHFLPGPHGEEINAFQPIIREKQSLLIYTKAIIEAIQSGYFLFCAHPDVYLYLREEFGPDEKAAAKDIISAAIDAHLPIEVNANGIFKAKKEGRKEYAYPRREFWELASEMGALCIKNSDAHTVPNLSSCQKELDQFTEELKLKMVEPVVKDGKILFQ